MAQAFTPLARADQPMLNFLCRAIVLLLVGASVLTNAEEPASLDTTCSNGTQNAPRGVLVVGSQELFRTLQALGVEVAFAELPEWNAHLTHGNPPGISKIGSMQPLLDYAVPLLQQYISRFNPLWVVVHSKGISVACELARLGLWRGRTLISSPIINPSDALGEDDYAEMAKLLNDSARVDFAIGMDEGIIMETLQDVSTQYGWPVHMFHGGHWWYSDKRNSMRMAKLVNVLSAP